jgi:hypothetical protein
MASKIPGTIRLAWTDPAKQAVYPLWESRTEPMSDNETDITKNPIIDKYSKIFEENDYLILQFAEDTATATTASNMGAKCRVPVTMFNKRTLQKFVTHITYGGPYSFTFTDATGVAKVYFNWGLFQVPLGMRMKLGWDNAYNSKVLISPYSS